MTNRKLIAATFSMIFFYAQAQDENSELAISKPHTSLLKVLVDPVAYDNKQVTLQGYAFVDETEEWRLFLGRCSCKDFDNWNSIVIEVTDDQARQFRKIRNSSNLHIPSNCFRISVSGLFKDYSDLQTQIHSAYAVGYLKQPQMHYPFSIGQDKEQKNSAGEHEGE